MSEDTTESMSKDYLLNISAQFEYSCRQINDEQEQ
jgi:hypothetical protein